MASEPSTTISDSLNPVQTFSRSDLQTARRENVALNSTGVIYVGSRTQSVPIEGQATNFRIVQIHFGNPFTLIATPHNLNTDGEARTLWEESAPSTKQIRTACRAGPDAIEGINAEISKNLGTDAEQRLKYLPSLFDEHCQLNKYEASRWGAQMWHHSFLAAVQDDDQLAINDPEGRWPPKGLFVLHPSTAENDADEDVPTVDPGIFVKQFSATPEDWVSDEVSTNLLHVLTQQAVNGERVMLQFGWIHDQPHALGAGAAQPTNLPGSCGGESSGWPSDLGR